VIGVGVVLRVAELPYFAEEVIPRLEREGLRTPRTVLA
jgi:hypothetical protein